MTTSMRLRFPSELLNSLAEAGSQGADLSPGDPTAAAAFNLLVDISIWMKRRESDIANGIEDFGALRGPFEKLFGRKPYAG